MNPYDNYKDWNYDNHRDAYSENQPWESRRRDDSPQWEDSRRWHNPESEITGSYRRPEQEMLQSRRYMNAHNNPYRNDNRYDWEGNRFQKDPENYWNESGGNNNRNNPDNQPPKGNRGQSSGYSRPSGYPGDEYYRRNRPQDNENRGPINSGPMRNQTFNNPNPENPVRWQQDRHPNLQNDYRRIERTNNNVRRGPENENYPQNRPSHNWDDNESQSFSNPGSEVGYGGNAFPHYRHPRSMYSETLYGWDFGDDSRPPYVQSGNEYVQSGRHYVTRDEMEERRMEREAEMRRNNGSDSSRRYYRD